MGRGRVEGWRCRGRILSVAHLVAVSVASAAGLSAHPASDGPPVAAIRGNASRDRELRRLDRPLRLLPHVLSGARWVDTETLEASPGATRAAILVRVDEVPGGAGCDELVTVERRGTWTIARSGSATADGTRWLEIATEPGATGASLSLPEVRCTWEVEARATGSTGAPGGSGRSSSGRVDPTRPEIVERASWGARPPAERFDPHRPEAIVIHHSWLPDAAGYLRVGGAESVAGIQRFHQLDPDRRWNDIGYHFLIGPDGLVFEGRPIEVVGSHAVPNTGKVGICLIGNHDPGGDPVSADSWSHLLDLVTWISHRYDIPVSEALFGHRAFSTKSCPGDLVHDRFDEIRREVRSRIGSMGEDGS